jgi:hypothetical protein
MKLRVIAAAAALVCSASQAFADQRVTVTLETPLAQPREVVASGTVWTCEGATCWAMVDSARAAGVAACKQLSSRVGRISAFGNGKTALEGEKLEKCNAGASVSNRVSSASS